MNSLTRSSSCGESFCGALDRGCCYSAMKPVDRCTAITRLGLTAIGTLGSTLGAYFYIGGVDGILIGFISGLLFSGFIAITLTFCFRKYVLKEEDACFLLSSSTEGYVASPVGSAPIMVDQTYGRLQTQRMAESTWLNTSKITWY